MVLQGSRRRVCARLRCSSTSSTFLEALQLRRRSRPSAIYTATSSSSSHQVRCASTPSVQDEDYVSSNGQRQVLHTRKNRVVVAMSGGVDSSVAAHLLQRISQKSSSYHPGTGGGDKISTTNKSVDIVGLHMSNWNALDEDASTTESMRRQSAETSSVSPKPSSNGTNFCQTSENEYNDAKSVAQHLDIPLHRVSFASEYWIQVFEPFIESLSSSSSSLSGEEEEDFITNNNNRHPQLMTTPMPNPDYGCNTYIKFGAMRDYAMNTLNADYVATGHYAQLWHRDYLTSSKGYRSKHCESSSLFHQWIAETSKSLEHQVLDSIRGRPEEDWILNNHLKQLTSSIGSSSDVVATLPMLLAGADRSKDQTYFLSGVKGKAFRNVIFPLGHLAKSQQSCTQLNHNNSSSNNNLDQTVRDIAEQANIPTASKRDSMGICFIGKRNFGQFVTQYLPETPRPGNFVDVDTGEIVGRHEGAVRYTLGEGAKISGAKLRYFVCGKGRTVVSGDGDDGNTVFVCNSTHHPALYADELFVDFDAFNWIGLGDGDAERGKYTHVPRPLVEGDFIRLLARVRHLQPLTTCTVTWIQSDNKSSSGDKGHLVVRFDKAMRAITPGQIVALYAGFDGLVCLGGGIISGRGDSYMNRGLDVTAGMLHPSGSNDLSLRLP